MVGLELGISITVGVLAGMWLDSRFHTSPWLLLLFMILGTAAGFRNLYKVMVQLEKGSPKNKNK